MCDVPSIAVFCSQSIECFPSMATKCFLKIFVIIPVAPVTTGIIINFILIGEQPDQNYTKMHGQKNTK
jgi:hypothetical protein